MSRVKSFSVGDGDMYYIKHNSDNFTVIDCCLYLKDGVKDSIIDEITMESFGRGITRFISTHPDDDHISGLVDYDKKMPILNFYCTKNETKKTETTEDFERYCELRDGDKSYYLEKDCKRRWMNQSDAERGSAGLSCYWPITSNVKYIDALLSAKDKKSPNNISPAIRYGVGDFSFLWMGDMETDMQKEMASCVVIPATTVVFAPHHGRKSGHMPSELMNMLSPKLIVVGEASSEDLDYYKGYNTITQNTAGDILFVNTSDYVDVFVSNKNYSKTDGMTNNSGHETVSRMYYLGSIKA